MAINWKGAFKANPLGRTLDTIKDRVESVFADPNWRGSTGDWNKNAIAYEQKVMDDLARGAQTPQGNGGVDQSGVDTGGGGGGGGYSAYNAYAAQQAAAQRQAEAEAAQRAAEEEAKRNQLREGIQNLIGQSQSIYDTLFGNVRSAAQSQRQALDKRFNEETGTLTEQFNQELPKIGQSYAGRGSYDSTYRTGAEEVAKKGFEGQIKTIGNQREADSAKIGQALLEQEAQFSAGKSLLGTMQSRLGEVTDINELTQLRNDLDKRVAELTSSQAGNQTREAYIQKFSQLAPANSRINELKTSLSTLINGAAPGPLKKAVAEQIIGSAGLSPEEEDQLRNQVIQQIA